MKLDIALKRGAYIGKVNSLLQEFNSVSPNILIKLINSFAACVYGSNLWDIFSKESERLYTSYSVSMRHALKLNLRTHRYLIEPLAETPHLKTMICSRYVSFFKSLSQCQKFPVRFLAKLQEKDMNTVLGRSLGHLADLCGVPVSNLSTGIVKEKIKYKEIPEQEKWRLPIAKELMLTRSLETEIRGFSSNEVEDMLSFICSC